MATSTCTCTCVACFEYTFNIKDDVYVIRRVLWQQVHVHVHVLSVLNIPLINIKDDVYFLRQHVHVHVHVLVLSVLFNV